MTSFRTRAFWSRKRKEPSDRHREFIYLDEVSVISLLAGLQGEIKESVTQTLARSEEHGLTASMGVPKAGAQLESRFGTSQTSTSEVVRRAVIQSTFRDLWRRDVGVLLHDTAGIKAKHLRPIESAHDLENALPRLTRLKLATPLTNITRGDLLEMDIRVEADHFFKMVTVGTTLLDLLGGRDELFGSSAGDFQQIAPMIEVFKELLVGLVPVRGVATSHSVIDIDGQKTVLATKLLGRNLSQQAQRLELVGFAEANSFWRDLRRTLFSDSIFTAYARVEAPVLTSPWSPLKIADLLDSVSPGLHDAVVQALQELEVDTVLTPEVPDAEAVARYQLDGFARALQTATGANPDEAALPEAIDTATLHLAAATSRDERRRAFDPVAQAIAGDSPDRETLHAIRLEWMDRQPEPHPSSLPICGPPPATHNIAAVQIEVGFVALYW